MSKNPKKNKGFHPKNEKTSPAVLPQFSEENTAAEPDIPQEIPRRLELKTLIGTINTELYERLLKPAFTSFSHRRDDEPLRQLVESIVTSIAMHDAYEGYRKIDDIFQRYLYYLESIDGAAKKNRESIELSALCDYWRTQVFMTLIRDSAAIFTLLLPDSQPSAPSAIVIPQKEFLQGVSTVLNNHLSPEIPTTRESAYSRDLYDFSTGISFPWLGFSPENIFGIQATIPNESIQFEHEFAIADAHQIAVFDRDIRDSLNACLFTDLVHAQHHKVYDELMQYFEPEDQLPPTLRDQLSKRIRFDKTYQCAYDSLLEGSQLTKQLHRSSRLSCSDLNAFGQFAFMIHCAANMNQGVYIFHFVG